MIRVPLCLLAALLGFASMLPAQVTPGVTARTWQACDPVPLPVQVVFFSSQPSNALDSATIHQATRAALTAARLPFESAVVSSFPATGPKQLHVRFEVNHYSAGELRIRSIPTGVDGEHLAMCASEEQSLVGGERLAVSLYLSHRVRDTLECMKLNYGIRWP